MSLPFREEVKLNQTGNAWIPTSKINATKSNIFKNENKEELKTQV